MYGHMATLCLVCRMSSRRKHAGQKLQMYVRLLGAEVQNLHMHTQGKSCKCMSACLARVCPHVRLLGAGRTKNKCMSRCPCPECAHSRGLNYSNLPLYEFVYNKRIYQCNIQPTCDAGGLLAEHYQDMRHAIVENNPTQKTANMMNDWRMSTSLNRCCLPLYLVCRMSSTPGLSTCNFLPVIPKHTDMHPWPWPADWTPDYKNKYQGISEPRHSASKQIGNLIKPLK